MSEIGLTKPDSETQDGVVYKTVRLSINLITHILMCLTLFVCIVYACTSNMTLFHWHIILCVLGYQFFMNQGTLVLSRYNSWSMHISRSYRIHLHVAFQLIGFVLIIVGSWAIASEKSSHFVTIHGNLGLFAAITSVISILNGVAARFAYKLSRSYVHCIKYTHYLTGILTLFLSTASLSAGLEGRSFRFWAANDDAVALLVVVTWLFTLFVALEFWIVTGSRLRSWL